MSTHPPRLDPNSRFTDGHKSHGQNTSAVRLLTLSHSSCRRTTLRSKTPTGARRCSQTESRLRPNSQPFGRRNSWMLPRGRRTDFLPHCLTSWSTSLRKRMCKVRWWRMSHISMISWHSRNRSKFPNTQSRWWLGTTCLPQPQSFDRGSAFLPRTHFTLDHSMHPRASLEYQYNAPSDHWDSKWH